MRFLLSLVAIGLFMWGALALLADGAARGFDVVPAVAGLAAMPVMLAIVGWIWSLLRRPK